MRKNAIVLVAFLTVAGCGVGSQKTVYAGPNGKVTTDNNNNVTYEGAKGEKMSVGGSLVSETDLGVPFYPGSKATEGKDLKVSADGKTNFMSNRTTSDDPAKVTAFYKGKITQPTETTSDKFAMVVGTLADKRKISVVATKGDTDVNVQVTVSSE